MIEQRMDRRRIGFRNQFQAGLLEVLETLEITAQMAAHFQHAHFVAFDRKRLVEVPVRQFHAFAHRHWRQHAAKECWEKLSADNQSKLVNAVAALGKGQQAASILGGLASAFKKS